MSTQLNLCNLPPWILASLEFNEYPQDIQIQGALHENQSLFSTLDAEDEAEERAHLFNDYMSVKFYLDQWQTENGHTSIAKSSLKNSYLRFLRGWGVDSNGIEGAVLKGWVESRFGLPPRYHRGVVSQCPEDYSPYLLDRTRGSARTNAIQAQLDLLYTFTQYELTRMMGKDAWLTLFRGTYDRAEHAVVDLQDRRRYTVALNNLSSFTSDREKAWEFGTTVWKVRIPRVKVFFFGALLPQSILKGENEYLVIGGQFQVEELLF